MRIRNAGVGLPAISVWVVYTTMTLPFHTSMLSPNAPMSVRKLVLLSTRPFSWLVNHTTAHRSGALFLRTISSETDLMRKAFSAEKVFAFMYFDWSNDDASRTMTVLPWLELRAVRVTAGKDRLACRSEERRVGKESRS